MVFCAAAVGLIVGLLVSVIQHVAMTPLILQAEEFEKSAAAHEAQAVHAPASAPSDAHHHALAPEAMPGAHVHNAQAWEPREGFERTVFTVLSNVVTGIGGALVLIGLFSLRGGPVDWRAGLFWGLAAFVAVLLAPSLGLPPTPPGVPEADLGERQLWWAATALATAAGLALLAFGRSPWLAALALCCIVAPHVVGAPRLEVVETNVPLALMQRFVAAATFTSLMFWALLGALSGAFYPRFAR